MKNHEMKGDKYVFYKMAHELCLANGGRVVVGSDSGMKGGEKYMRAFRLQEYQGKTLLVESKNSASFAEFSRVVEVIGGLPRFYTYINEDGENGYTWKH